MKGNSEMKKNLRRLFALGLGFIIGCIFVGILIYFGYYHAYEAAVKSVTVKFLGLSLYEIVQNGETYVGTAIGPNIGVISTIFALLALLVEEAWLRLVGKKKK